MKAPIGTKLESDPNKIANY